MAEQCEACTSTKLEPATLVSAALQPDRASTWKKVSAGAVVSCRVCMDCGAIDRLRADVERIRNMLPDT